MIKLLNKTIFNVNCDAIVNTVNCVGVMGAGLALEVALRYPLLEKLYLEDCRKKAVKIGELKIYSISNTKIINFPTKQHWKYPSKIEWIELGLDYFVSNWKSFKIKSIAFPPLGCSNGGLDFNTQVFPLMKKKLSNIPIDIYICNDPGYPEGKEKDMLDTFKQCNLSEVCEDINIRLTEEKILYLYRDSIHRFFEIKNLKGIGIRTYKKLFCYFYNGHKVKQLTLF